MGANVRFMPPPPPAGRTVSATGGTGLPFAITSGSDAPDAAAAYLDFITSPDAMRCSQRPATSLWPAPPSSSRRPGSRRTSSRRSPPWPTAGSSLPYLDYATPTMADTMGTALQDLLAGQQTPEQFLATVQADYTSFVDQNG